MRSAMTRTTLAGGLAGMLLITACSGAEPAASVTDEDSVLAAIADSFAGSWSWSGQLDVQLTDAQIETLAEMEADDGFTEPEVVRRWVRRGLDELERQRMHGALGADQSFRSAWQRHDTDLVDLRLGFGEVLLAESMTPEASLLGAVDVPAIATWIADLREVDPMVAGMEIPSVDALKQQARQFIDDAELLRVVVAILDGGFGGVVGQLDFAEMGVTEDQLDEVREGFAEDLIGLADAETFRALAAEAVTIRDITADDEVTRAVVDLHPQAAADAVYDLFDDAERLAEDLAGDYVLDEDMPETIEEVAQLTFDADGNLTEVRTDVLGIAGQLTAVMDLTPEDTELLATLRGATAHVVFGFGDHDAVDTVMDVDATTMTWDDIVGFFDASVEDALDG